MARSTFQVLEMIEMKQSEQIKIPAFSSSSKFTYAKPVAVDGPTDSR